MKKISHAQLFLESFRIQGILILAGASKDQSYQDEEVLKGLHHLLMKANEQYDVFDLTLIDFHGEGRRQREVKVVMRQSLLVQNRSRIVPGERLKVFQRSLSPDKQAHIKRFLSGESQKLVAVSEGTENQELHALFYLPIHGSEHTVRSMEVPVINLYETGHFRKKSLSHAFVYTVVKKHR